MTVTGCALVLRFSRSWFAILALAILFTGTSGAQDLPDNIDISAAPEGIVPMPRGLPRAFRRFNRYTKVITANGKAIHIIAQSRISVGQIVRAREILRMFLADVPGSEFGGDKAQLGNRMASNDAMLMLVNGTHSEGNEPDLPAQPLYQNEMQVEGHRWYMEQDYDHRDATFEEILHLVHDTGIGVDGRNTLPGVLPAYQAEIRRATNNAMAGNFQIWPLGAGQDREWFEELAEENSLTQEYLASLIDSYYGLWGAWRESASFGMWGEYIAKTRAEIRREDPVGWSLMGKFFPEQLTYEARIDPGFPGTFRMSYDRNYPYTNHSQYLLKPGGENQVKPPPRDPQGCPFKPPLVNALSSKKPVSLLMAHNIGKYIRNTQSLQRLLPYPVDKLSTYAMPWIMTSLMQSHWNPGTSKGNSQGQSGKPPTCNSHLFHRRLARRRYPPSTVIVSLTSQSSPNPRARGSSPGRNPAWILAIMS